MSDFREHWLQVSFGDVATKLVDGSHNPPAKQSAGVPMLSARNIANGSIKFDEYRLISSADFEREHKRTCVQAGDVLITIVGSIGRSAMVKESTPAFALQRSVAVTCIPHASSQFLSYQIQAPEFQHFLETEARGTAQRGVYLNTLASAPLWIAPIEEQRRLVEAIESYFTRLDDAMVTLDRVQRNLKRYRASVLKAAVEGRLVPTEAELARMEGREYEPASELLERILAERRRRWEEAELAKMQAKGTVPKNDKWKARYVEPASPDTSELPELPEGWRWARTEQCVMTQVGHAFSSGEFIEEGVNLLRGDNIGHGSLRWDGNRRRCIRPEALLDYAHLELEPGDIVLAMDRPIISTGLKFAHVQPSDLPALLVQRVIRMRSSLHIGYFDANIQSQHFIEHLEREARGGGVPHISEGQIKNFVFPITPLAEQIRIAQEIERLLSTSESSIKIVLDNAQRVTRLRQSILKWAFEGRLVDQDPNDEPAELLLERIRAERAASQGKKHSRTRRVNTSSASA